MAHKIKPFSSRGLLAKFYSALSFIFIFQFPKYRDLIRERTGAGRVAAKQREVRFGRPKKMNEEQKLLAKRLLEEDKSVSEIAKTFNVHKATIYRLQNASELA